MEGLLNFIVKLGGKMPLEKPRHEWEDDIEIDVRGIGKSVVWVQLVCGKIRGLCNDTDGLSSFTVFGNSLNA